MLISTNPEFLNADGGLRGGNNMAAIHLANAVGGNIFLGFISAVAFATILAVVSGLTLAGAAAVSHDLYACALKKGKVNEKDELFVSKISVVTLGCVAIFLGIVFEKQNVAFMVGLAFAVAASTNFSNSISLHVLEKTNLQRRLNRRQFRSYHSDNLGNSWSSSLGRCLWL